jgi:hypothetical protein
MESKELVRLPAYGDLYALVVFQHPSNLGSILHIFCRFMNRFFLMCCSSQVGRRGMNYVVLSCHHHGAARRSQNYPQLHSEDMEL